MILGATTISDEQALVHKTAEAAALFVGLPFLVYLATRKELPTWARAGAGLFAISTLVIDGGLLLQWRKRGV